MCACRCATMACVMPETFFYFPLPLVAVRCAPLYVKRVAPTD
jgi:hypothetical protein